jgi:hypothetical protein
MAEMDRPVMEVTMTESRIMTQVSTVQGEFETRILSQGGSQARSY